MTVKLYVNWDDEKILTEAEYEKEKAKTITEHVELPDDELVDRWISSLPSDDYLNLFFALTNEKIRDRLLKEWKGFCEEIVNEQMYDYYEETEVEV